MSVAHDVTIPPNHIGHIQFTTDQEFNGDLFMDFQVRCAPAHEYILPRCVTSSSSGLLPVLNASNNMLKFKSQETIARGTPCQPEDDLATKSVSVLQIDSTRTIKPILLNKSNCDESLGQRERQRLANLLNKYRDCFAENLSELGFTNKCEMSIELSDTKPVTYRPYRLSISERNKVREIVDDLLANKIIQESHSPYASPILLVKKKTGEMRMCVDYRALNAKTVKDCYPLPRIDDHLERLRGCQYFTSLDMASGYHQIPMAKDAVNKTAFITPDGHYEYLRMPFGLANAPAVFQRCINMILGSLRFTTALAYMDDILIPSSTLEAGFEALEEIFSVFSNAGLTLRLAKCYFFRRSIEYLGHEISSEGVRPGKAKIIAVEKFPVPKNVHEVRQFLGLASYFRKYVKDFACIARPLTMLIKKNQAFLFGEEQVKAFKQLKEIICTRPVLAIYNPDLQTELHTDASKLGIGGILLQKQRDDRFKPVQYFSRQTSKEEQHYHSYELETLAVVNSMQRFRVYLLGIEFKVVTDCNSIRSTFTKKDLVPRIARWWITTLEFNFTVEYRPGSRMAHVDALSRNPVEGNDESETNVDLLSINISEADWVLSAQLTDDRCKFLYQVLSDRPTDMESRNIHEEYTLKDNRIFKITRNGPRWVVPRNARRAVTAYYHDSAGHFALEKTLSAISQNYWFPQMRKYIDRHIRCCLACAYNKEPSGKRPGLLHPIEKIPIHMDTIHIDHLVGPLINFVDSIIEVFGTPKRIICDQGTCYSSKAFKEYTTRLNVKLVQNATATPRSNGQVERYNRTLMTGLCSMTDD
nr:unnamed protein product [Callosobruchus analis]